MEENTPITVAYGDGIGPEIMDATLHIIKAAGARIDVETIEVGEKVYLRGISAGIEPSGWDELRRTRVFLKAPITTPQGGGYKSLNVTTRVMLSLSARRGGPSCRDRGWGWAEEGALCLSARPAHRFAPTS